MTDEPGDGAPERPEPVDGQPRQAAANEAPTGADEHPTEQLPAAPAPAPPTAQAGEATHETPAPLANATAEYEHPAAAAPTPAPPGAPYGPPPGAVPPGAVPPYAPAGPADRWRRAATGRPLQLLAAGLIGAVIGGSAVAAVGAVAVHHRLGHHGYERGWRGPDGPDGGPDMYRHGRRGGPGRNAPPWREPGWNMPAPGAPAPPNAPVPPNPPASPSAPPSPSASPS